MERGVLFGAVFRMLFNLLCVANQYYRSDELFFKILNIFAFFHLRDETHRVMMVFIFGHKMRTIFTFLGFRCHEHNDRRTSIFQRFCFVCWARRIDPAFISYMKLDRLYFLDGATDAIRCWSLERACLVMFMMISRRQRL